MPDDQRDVVARALYEHAIHQPGCVSAAPWEKVAPGVRLYHLERADAALRAVRQTTPAEEPVAWAVVDEHRTVKSTHRYAAPAQEIALEDELLDVAPLYLRSLPEPDGDTAYTVPVKTP